MSSELTKAVEAVTWHIGRAGASGRAFVQVGAVAVRVMDVAAIYVAEGAVYLSTEHAEHRATLEQAAPIVAAYAEECARNAKWEEEHKRLMDAGVQRDMRKDRAKWALDLAPAPTEAPESEGARANRAERLIQRLERMAETGE